MNACIPYPTRATLGAPRVESWIDCYWRTGEVPHEPFDGAIIKLTEGSGDYFDQHQAWATRHARRFSDAGKGLQYYAFGRPDTPHKDGHLADARAEAQSCVRALNAMPRPTRLRFMDGTKCDVWHDLEKDVANLNERQGFEWVDAWSRYVEAQGYLVGLYLGDDWLDAEATPDADSVLRLFTRDDGSFRPIWCARYGRNDGVARLSEYPVEEKCPVELLRRQIVAAKQFTSRRVTPGVADPHDLNLLYLA